jgi:hypothetical protein
MFGHIVDDEAEADETCNNADARSFIHDEVFEVFEKSEKPIPWCLGALCVLGDFIARDARDLHLLLAAIRCESRRSIYVTRRMLK